ncbi:MarR family winged helix-turn-helix transcriptional regulator [Enterococcus sp. 22-H-5-01]|uniref:MarR family winged helix-turn-helix transcriptional regulator n=1 Tax=Enterococcus sp. 22-H-5-01 TaxID=3418555 RepID=UPI003CFDE433
MENQMNEQFMKLQHDLRRYYHRQIAKNQTFGAHRGQGRVLALLKMNPEISQKDLTFVLGMRPQSVGELLQKLEEKEFITREASEEDRRVMIIRLTELGKAEAEKLSETPDFGEDLFAEFTDEDKQEWTRLVDKLSETLKKQLGEENTEDFFGGGREANGHHGHGGPHGFGGPHGHGPFHGHHFENFGGCNW